MYKCKIHNSELEFHSSANMFYCEKCRKYYLHEEVMK